MTEAVDWLEWHRAYDDPESRLSARLRVVQRRIAEALHAYPDPLRVVSMCAGQGRDLIGALADHERRGDVTALLVELDERNIAIARDAVRAAALDGVRVVRADAALSDSYEGGVPAEVVLACGVFGNISDAEVLHTVARIPMLCAARATVIWTRYRDPERDFIPTICEQFERAGFEQVSLDTSEELRFGVGVHRLVTEPPKFVRGERFFTFLR
jgi:hypothetical protein